ncbi:hypothetical protein, partial [Nocardia abscessus]|uniref:hypothetical protein n=1 Tax=Nocardia abscessus TaxID=120957 RepID=UPI00245651B9
MRLHPGVRVTFLGDALLPFGAHSGGRLETRTAWEPSGGGGGGGGRAGPAGPARLWEGGGGGGGRKG